MADEVQIQVRFTISEEGYPSYTDALYVSLDEYEDMKTDGRLEALKQERYGNWRQIFDNPPAPPEVIENPVSSVEQARTILNDALAQLDALPPDES